MFMLLSSLNLSVIIGGAKDFYNILEIDFREKKIHNNDTNLQSFNIVCYIGHMNCIAGNNLLDLTITFNVNTMSK